MLKLQKLPGRKRILRISIDHSLVSVARLVEVAEEAADDDDRKDVKGGILLEVAALLELFATTVELMAVVADANEDESEGVAKDDEAYDA